MESTSKPEYGIPCVMASLLNATITKGGSDAILRRDNDGVQSRWR
jgi:hypothetical protein